MFKKNFHISEGIKVIHEILLFVVINLLEQCKVLPPVQDKGNKRSTRTGHPLPGYSLSLKGELVFDPIILKILKNYKEQEEFQNWIGLSSQNGG